MLKVQYARNTVLLALTRGLLFLGMIAFSPVSLIGAAAPEEDPEYVPLVAEEQGLPGVLFIDGVHKSWFNFWSADIKAVFITGVVEQKEATQEDIDRFKSLPQEKQLVLKKIYGIGAVGVSVVRKDGTVNFDDPKNRQPVSAEEYARVHGEYWRKPHAYVKMYVNWRFRELSKEKWPTFMRCGNGPTAVCVASGRRYLLPNGRMAY